MTDAKDNSSLPLLFAISGTILAVAVGGWFFLEQKDQAEAAASSPPVVTQSSMAPAVLDETAPPGETEDVAAEPEVAEVARAVEVVDAPTTGVDAELRKARLAADADILVVPAAQSALHYYGRILDVDPRHEIANAELDALLARVAQSVNRHLDAEEFSEAYEIAALVARRRPEHELVIATQQTLDAHTEQLVEQAIQDVRDGNDDAAMQAIAAAERLPGRNPEYFAAIRDSVAEIQDARRAAERDRRQRIDSARAAWMQSVRGAIARGDLIAPEGGSARDLLAERNNFANERTQLSAELVTALFDTAAVNIDTELFDEAGTLIDAADELGADESDVAELRAALETAIIERRSNTPVPLSNLVRTRTVAPVYPRRATRSQITGYVDLVFTVTPSGETADIEVYGAEPENIFNEAAIEAISQWEFEPVEFRGRVISQRTGARVVFKLE